MKQRVAILVETQKLGWPLFVNYLELSGEPIRQAIRSRSLVETEDSVYSIISRPEQAIGKEFDLVKNFGGSADLYKRIAPWVGRISA